MEDALAHQMIHMFDHATTNIQWSNAQQMACSEIRATSLGGECRWIREFMRGYVGFGKHHQRCVKRRAIETMVIQGFSQDVSRDAVYSTFDSCFKDTAPFDEIY